MDEKPEQIRQRIAFTRASLDERLNLLEARVRETFSLRRRIGGRPWTAVGTAVAAGLLMGLLRRRVS